MVSVKSVAAVAQKVKKISGRMPFWAKEIARTMYAGDF